MIARVVRGVVGAFVVPVVFLAYGRYPGVGQRQGNGDQLQVVDLAVGVRGDVIAVIDLADLGPAAGVDLGLHLGEHSAGVGVREPPPRAVVGGRDRPGRGVVPGAQCRVRVADVADVGGVAVAGHQAVGGIVGIDLHRGVHDPPDRPFDVIIDVGVAEPEEVDSVAVLVVIRGQINTVEGVQQNRTRRAVDGLEGVGAVTLARIVGPTELDEPIRPVDQVDRIFRVGSTVVEHQLRLGALEPVLALVAIAGEVRAAAVLLAGVIAAADQPRHLGRKGQIDVVDDERARIQPSAGEHLVAVPRLTEGIARHRHPLR